MAYSHILQLLSAISRAVAVTTTKKAELQRFEHPISTETKNDEPLSLSFLVIGDWGRREGHTYDWRGIISRKAYRANILKQDLESAFKESMAKWKIIVGHHAIRSIGHHGDTQELIRHILPLLKTYDVDFYMNGHDHCLEHISDRESPIQFLTSGAGSKAWRGDIKEENGDGLNFFYDGQGFMSVKLTQFEAEIKFYDVHGKVLHRWNKIKQPRHSSV
ncbi:hypothetical protein WN944_014899 [Citrus x changshan-huyou]|uniref:Calcineurin-like phosphoesterase domain-containing protein n=1 Tax=Citrus x changshan-huyou TaxID=2935761 RepID=A0AAP0M8P9_9ROSI